MQQASTLIHQVIVMFLLILVGFFCTKAGMITPRANKQISNFVLTIVSAALILDVFQQDITPEITVNLLWALALSFLILLIGWGVSQSLRIGSNPGELGTEQFSVIFPNSGYMGIPLLAAMIGPVGVLYSSAFMIAFSVLSWTIGVGTLTHSFNKKLILTALASPVMISILIGLPMLWFGIKFPAPIAETVDLISSLLTPLAMIVSGSFIAQSNVLRSFTCPRNYLAALIRLCIIPLIMLPILLFFPISADLKNTMLILASAPCATGTIQFSARFGGSISRANGAFTISTLLCVATMPLIMLIGQQLWAQ